MYWHSRSKKTHPTTLVPPTKEHPVGFLIPEMEEDGHHHEELYEKAMEGREDLAKRSHRNKRSYTIECGRFQGKKAIKIERDD